MTRVDSHRPDTWTSGVCRRTGARWQLCRSAVLTQPHARYTLISGRISTHSHYRTEVFSSGWSPTDCARKTPSDSPTTKRQDCQSVSPIYSTRCIQFCFESDPGRPPKHDSCRVSNRQRFQHTQDILHVSGQL